MNTSVSAQTWIEIQPSVLVARIVGGAARSLGNDDIKLSLLPYYITKRM